MQSFPPLHFVDGSNHAFALDMQGNEAARKTLTRARIRA